MSDKSIMQIRGRTGPIAVIDVGSTKVCCLIARNFANGAPSVAGIGHNASHGLKGGVIVDLDAAEAAIRAAVATAEKMAGERIHQVTVNLASAHMTSRLIAYEISIAGHEITEADLRGMFDPSVCLGGDVRNHELIHAIPVGYTVDGSRGVKDPRGMYGDRLGVNLHLASAPPGPMRNLETCIARCHLDIEHRVVSPYASALACLVDDEKELGATLIDMGGGTTTVSVFFEGKPVFFECLPLGGAHVTNDVATILSTPLAEAERLKILYGNLLGSGSAGGQSIRAPLMGEEDEEAATEIPRAMLVNIIRPRLEEIFEITRARLERAGLDRQAGRHAVITGGASQLPGVRELASEILGKQIRLARPKPIDGLAEAVSGPAFSTSIGLLNYAFTEPAKPPLGEYGHVRRPSKGLGRVGQWLRDNF